jgi:hypothetical protein
MYLFCIHPGAIVCIGRYLPGYLLLECDLRKIRMHPFVQRYPGTRRYWVTRLEMNTTVLPSDTGLNRCGLTKPPDTIPGVDMHSGYGHICTSPQHQFHNEDMNDCTARMWPCGKSACIHLYIGAQPEHSTSSRVPSTGSRSQHNPAHTTTFRIRLPVPGYPGTRVCIAVTGRIVKLKAHLYSTGTNVQMYKCCCYCY